MEAALNEARRQVAALRLKMASMKVGSRKWVEVEGDLNFWQGKVACYENTVGWAK